MGFFSKKPKETKGAGEAKASLNQKPTSMSDNPINQLDEIDIDEMTNKTDPFSNIDKFDDEPNQESSLDSSNADFHEEDSYQEDSYQEDEDEGAVEGEDEDEEEEEVPTKKRGFFIFGKKSKNSKGSKNKGLNFFARKSKSNDAEVFVLTDHKRYGIVSYLKHHGLPIYSLNTNPQASMDDILLDTFNYSEDELPKVYIVIIDSGHGKFITQNNIDIIKTIVETAFKDIEGSQVLICTSSQQIVGAINTLRDTIKAEGRYSIKEFNARVEILKAGTISAIPKHIKVSNNYNYKENMEIKDELDVDRIITEIYPKIDIPEKLKKKLKDRREVTLDVPVYSENTPELSLRQYGTAMKGENGKPLIVETISYNAETKSIKPTEKEETQSLDKEITEDDFTSTEETSEAINIETTPQKKGIFGLRKK